VREGPPNGTAGRSSDPEAASGDPVQILPENQPFPRHPPPPPPHRPGVRAGPSPSGSPTALRRTPGSVFAAMVTAAGIPNDDDGGEANNPPAP